MKKESRAPRCPLERPDRKRSVPPAPIIAAALVLASSLTAAGCGASTTTEAAPETTVAAPAVVDVTTVTATVSAIESALEISGTLTPPKPRWPTRFWSTTAPRTCSTRAPCHASASTARRPCIARRGPARSGRSQPGPGRGGAAARAKCSATPPSLRRSPVTWWSATTTPEPFRATCPWWWSPICDRWSSSRPGPPLNRPRKWSCPGKGARPGARERVDRAGVVRERRPHVIRAQRCPGPPGADGIPPDAGQILAHHRRRPGQGSAGFSSRRQRSSL